MTSVEDQLRAARIGKLIDIPARFRALSIEPLLGTLTLKQEWLEQLDWVIVGGESGGHARPMNPGWVRSLQRQCASFEVKFFFKQWGCWSPDKRFLQPSLDNVAYFEPGSDATTYLRDFTLVDRMAITENPDGKVFMFHGEKRKTGHLLDGLNHRAHPFGKKISEREIAVPLSPEERRLLEGHERIIREGLNSFVAVGSALTEIRDTRLYRATHATFQDYVQSVLALSRPRAYELITGAQVMNDLSAIADKVPLPQNEAQVRDLCRLKTPEERIMKWEEVVAAADSRPLTAKFIHEVLHPGKIASAKKPDSGSKGMACIAGLRECFQQTEAETESLELIARLEFLLENQACAPEHQRIKERIEESMALRSSKTDVEKYPES